MQKSMRISGIFICVCILVLSLALFTSGCTSQTSTPKNTNVGTNSASNANNSHTLVLSGSTTVLPIAAKAAEAFMTKNSNFDVQVTGGGSGVGVTAAGEGTANIGMSSRDLNAAEMTKYPSLNVITIAKDGVVIIVNPVNTVNSLTLKNIAAIYNGTITNWKQLGGSDAPIVIVGRDSASGTRDYFNSAVMKNLTTAKTMLEKNSNGAIQQTIAQVPGSIGYVGLGYVDTTVKAVPLNVNGTLMNATVDSVKTLTYPLSRNLYFITKGQPSKDAKTFIDYILSPEGQKIVADVDYVPL